MASAAGGYRFQQWPLMPNGTVWDGKHLLELMHGGNRPFGDAWDARVKLMLGEVETQTQSQVVDIPMVYRCANNYGFHIKLSNERDVMARFARADVNAPNCDGLAFSFLRNEVELEAAIYRLLEGSAEIPITRLFYFRQSKQSPGEPPTDISGRRLMLFDMSKGDFGLWRELSQGQKQSLLIQVARSRAALFTKPLTTTFVANWIFWTSFRPVAWMPKILPLPVAANREFCIALMKAKIEGMIGEVGSPIGWPENELTVGPRAFAAKRSFFRLIPRILPQGNDDLLYRFVLQHDKFGIRNLSVDVDDTGGLSLTSVYGWESGRVIPAILSEIEFSIAGCDLIID